MQKIQVMLFEEVHAQLKRVAAKRGLGISTYVRMVLHRALKEEEVNNEETTTPRTPAGEPERAER